MSMIKQLSNDSVTFSVEGMELEALLNWIGIFLPCESIEEFILGGYYLEVLKEIAPQYERDVPPAPHGEKEILELGAFFDKSIKEFDLKELHFPHDSDILKIHWKVVAKWAATGDPFIDGEARLEGVKILKILLGSAVKCDEKAKFVMQITQLEAGVKMSLMKIIQQELLKEPVKSPQQHMSEVEQLRRRVEELERESENSRLLRERNKDLVKLAQQLEEQLEEMKEQIKKGTSDEMEESNLEWKAEQSALKEKLRIVQMELGKKEEEMTEMEAAVSATNARMREARTLKDDLDLAQERIRVLEAEVERRGAEVPNINKEMIELREQLKNVEEENDKLKHSANECTKLKKEIASLKSEAIRFKVDYEQMENALVLKKEEAEKHSKAFVSAKGEIGSLTLELENVKQELIAVKQLGPQSKGRDSVRVPSLLDEMGNDETETVKKELEEKNEELAALQESIEEEREQFKEILREKSNDKRVESCMKEIDSLKKERESLKQQQGATDNEQVKGLNQQIAILEKEKEELKKSNVETIKALEKERDAHKEIQVKAKNTEDKETVEQVKGLNQQIAILEKEKEELKKSNAESVKALEKERDALKVSVGKQIQGNAHNTEENEIIKSLEEERDQLKHYLKLAKEKLLNSNAPNSAETETKALSSHIHIQGLKILRLKHEVESLKQKQSQSYNSKQNGLLNHLRAQIDPFN